MIKKGKMDIGIKLTILVIVCCYSHSTSKETKVLRINMSNVTQLVSNRIKFV